MLRRLLTLAKIDFRSRYAGHFLGVFWAFLYPAATALLYFLVFRVILKTGPVDGSPYLIWLVSALVPFLFVSEAAAASSASLIDYSYLARKSRLSVGMLPAARVLSCLPVHAVFLAALFVIKGGVSLSDLMIFVYIFAELVFSLAAGCFLAVVTVFFRDLRSLIPIMTQLGFWITPVFWSFDSVPEPFGTILHVINPASYISEGFRSVLAHSGSVPLFCAVYFWIFTLILSAVSACLFYSIHSRIVDYL